MNPEHHRLPDENMPPASIYALVPAAGVGQRMGVDSPKQYIEIHGKTVLDHTLSRLLEVSGLQRVIVAVHPQDPYYRDSLFYHHPRLTWVTGGASRAESVDAALQALQTMTHVQAQDWILVHDAARPCVRVSDINHMLLALHSVETGGVLAIPSVNTLKQTQEHHPDSADNSVSSTLKQVATTLDRHHIWSALTPQIFRYQAISKALAFCMQNNIPVTDEAMAIESADMPVSIVEGCPMNIKITYPVDVDIAKAFLPLTSEQNVKHEQSN